MAQFTSLPRHGRVANAPVMILEGAIKAPDRVAQPAHRLDTAKRHLQPACPSAEASSGQSGDASREVLPSRSARRVIAAAVQALLAATIR